MKPHLLLLTPNGDGRRVFVDGPGVHDGRQDQQQDQWHHDEQKQQPQHFCSVRPIG